MLKKNLNFGVTILTFITGKFKPRPLTSCLFSQIPMINVTVDLLGKI